MTPVAVKQRNWVYGNVEHLGKPPFLAYASLEFCSVEKHRLDKNIS